MLHSARRSAFTLIELLMVVGIVVLLAVILVPATLRFQERSQVATGIAALQGYIAQAKARAIASKRPYGIRFLAMRPEDRTVPATGLRMAWYDRIEFIESPGEYSEGFVWSYRPAMPQSRLVPVPSWNNGAPITYAGLDAPTQVLTFEIVGTAAVDNPAIPNLPAGIPLVANRLYGAVGGLNFSASAWPGYPGAPAQQKQINPFSFAPTANMQPMVEAGDFVQIHGIGQQFRVLGVQFNVGIIPTHLILDRDLPQDVVMPLNGMPNYRVIRQPRAIPGIPAVKLPGEVLVDLNSSGGAANPVQPIASGGDLDQTGQIWMRGISRGINTTMNWTPAQAAPRYVDLLFNEAGQLMPTGRSFAANEAFTTTSDGVIYLWVHPAASPSAWASGSPSAAQGDADNQAIISIGSRSGAISAFPVSLNSANPWESAQQGRAEGVGGF